MFLLLMRHGIAVELEELRRLPQGRHARDVDRPLSPIGIRKTKRVARGLRTLKIRPDVVLHSGLLRARETAEIVAKELQPRRPGLVVTEALAHWAEPTTLFEVLVKQKARVIVAVGHCPHVDRFIALACDATKRLITSMGKAGVICLALQDSGRPAGRIVWMLPPKLLRRLAR